MFKPTYSLGFLKCVIYFCYCSWSFFNEICLYFNRSYKSDWHIWAVGYRLLEHHLQFVFTSREILLLTQNWFRKIPSVGVRSMLDRPCLIWTMRTKLDSSCSFLSTLKTRSYKKTFRRCPVLFWTFYVRSSDNLCLGE